MIGQLLKKNSLVLLRNKQEFIVLLLMPIVLISILGFALADMMNGESASLNAKVYLIEHGSEDREAEQFIADLRQSALPAEAQEGIAEAVSSVLPISILKNEVFGDESLEENIQFETADASELASLEDDEETTAIIEVPEGFTYQFLQQLFLDSGEKPQLILLQNESESYSAGMVEEVIIQFQEQYAISNLLQEENMPESVADAQSAVGNIDITTENIDQRPIVSSLAYYTFGMITMFVFYVASTISSMAILEKDHYVFGRILLANVSRFSYIASMAVTGFLFTLCQLGLLFAFVRIVYGLELPNLPMLLVVSLLLSFSISGFTALLTAISFRSVNAQSVSDAFSSTVVTIMAFLGGSFFPLEFVQGIGKYLPNGAAMQAYLLVYQDYDWTAIAGHLMIMFAYGVVLLAIGVLIFPRKERA